MRGAIVRFRYYAYCIVASAVSACSAGTGDKSTAGYDLTLRCDGTYGGEGVYFYAAFKGTLGIWSSTIESERPVPISIKDYQSFATSELNEAEINAAYSFESGRLVQLHIDRSDGRFTLTAKEERCPPRARDFSLERENKQRALAGLPPKEPTNAKCRLEKVLEIIGNCEVAPIPDATRKF